MLFYRKLLRALSYISTLCVVAGIVFIQGTGHPSRVMAAETKAAAASTETGGGALLSLEELDQLVGPIALYPDELLAIVLPAATYPLEIVQASRYLEKRKQSPDLKPEEDWDPSILGLLNYPDVVDKMNGDLDWTWKLGEAVVNQQSDVMDAIQHFRSQAHTAGNLESSEQVVIVQEKEIIRIESASPEVIYVPTYQPATVIVQQPAPYPYVYSAPYPYYYNPAATFWTGMFVGAAIGYGLGWHGHGHNDININRNVNIKGGNRYRGGGNTWNGNRGAGRGRQGGRPGRAGAGSRPGRAGSRPGAGGRKPAAGRSRPSAGSRPSRTSNRTGRAGSMGGYKRGQTASSHSRRGNVSRSRPSSSRRSSGRSSSRGGGGRSGGGRGGGRRR